MQKDNSNSSAGAGADSEQNDQDLSVSQHSIKPNVVGSQCHGMEKESVQPIKEFGHFVFDENGEVSGVACKPAFYALTNEDNTEAIYVMPENYTEELSFKDYKELEKAKPD